MICSAMTLPMPGRFSSSSFAAVLIFVRRVVSALQSPSDFELRSGTSRRMTRRKRSHRRGQNERASPDQVTARFLAGRNSVSRCKSVVVMPLRGCRSRVDFAKSLMIPKVRMFYGALSTDFSTVSRGKCFEAFADDFTSRGSAT